MGTLQLTGICRFIWCRFVTCVVSFASVTRDAAVCVYYKPALAVCRQAVSHVNVCGRGRQGVSEVRL